jgi:hypothetical protein
MGFRENIETIAGKKELTEKVDKALTTAEEAKKEAILAQRVVSTQAGNGLPTTTNGNNGAGYSQEVFDSDGEVQAPVNAPLFDQTLIAVDHGVITAAARDYLERNRLFLDQHLSSNNDLSNSANPKSTSSASGGGTTRTESKAQADPDNAGDTGWDDYKQALIDSGASQAAIDAARQEYWARESGKYEISDVYNGDAGPSLNYGNWQATQDERGLLNAVTSAVTTLNALVGLDPNDNTQAIELRLDGKSAIPSIEEALAAGQNPWTDGVTPPLKPGYENWQFGYYWQDNGDWPTPNAGADDRAEQLSILTGHTYTYQNMRVTAVDGGGIPTQYTYDLLDNGTPAGSVNSIRAGSGTSCTISHGEYICPPEALRETAWPVVGLYAMTMQAAQWIFSQYDSEIPLKYISASSTIYMQSAITGDTYAVEAATQGGTLIYNDTNPEYLLYYGADRTLKAVAPISAYKFFTNKVR